MDASVHNIDEQEASEETTGIVVPEVDAEVNTATHNASDGNHSSSTVDPVAGVDASQGDAEGDVEVANVHEIKPEQQRHWRQAEMDATVVRLQAQVRRHLANKFIQRKKEENAPSHECVAARDNSAATKIQAMVRRRQLAGKLNLLRELRDLQRLNWWQNVDSTERDEAPLFLAAHHGDLLKIESILEDQSKRANSRKRAGLKPGNIGPNQILLGECPEPRRSGSTPLIEAARAGQVQAMALLLEKKADVRIQNTSGDTALSVAIQQAVESLEGGHGGASPNSAANNQRDPKEQDPKSGSRRGGALDTQAIDFLLSRNANIDKRDGCGRPPIHLAVFSNDVEILQYLLRNKVERRLRAFALRGSKLTGDFVNTRLP